MSQLKRRIARLETPTNGTTIDFGATLAERLAEMRRNATRAESDPEFAARLQRQAHERAAQMDRDYRAGRLDGIALRLHEAKLRAREPGRCR